MNSQFGIQFGPPHRQWAEICKRRCQCSDNSDPFPKQPNRAQWTPGAFMPAGGDLSLPTDFTAGVATPLSPTVSQGELPAAEAALEELRTRASVANPYYTDPTASYTSVSLAPTSTSTVSASSISSSQPSATTSYPRFGRTGTTRTRSSVSTAGWGLPAIPGIDLIPNLPAPLDSVYGDIKAHPFTVGGLTLIGLLLAMAGKKKKGKMGRALLGGFLGYGAGVASARLMAARSLTVAQAAMEAGLVDTQAAG